MTTDREMAPQPREVGYPDEGGLGYPDNPAWDTGTRGERREETIHVPTQVGYMYFT